jgi:hypothetical protein
MVWTRDWGGIPVRVDDSGKGGMVGGSMESLLDLYRHELHVLRVLSPESIEIFVKAEEGRVCRHLEQ